MADFGDVDPFSGQTNERTGYGALDQNAPSVANGRITPEQWADYQAKRKKDLILGLLGVLGATTGLGAVGGAMNGAGAAASGTSAMGAIPGGAPWAVTPYASTVAASGAGAAGAGGAAAAGAGAAGAAGSGAGAGMSARDWLSLGAGAAGTLGGALSKPPDLSPNTGTSDPQLRELLNLMMGRLKKSEPLHDSVLSMANGLLPTQYQNGGRGNG